jgi:hypothetical protein
MDLATVIGDDYSRLRQSLSSSGRTLFFLASSFIEHLSHAPRGGPLFTSPKRHTTTMGLGGSPLEPFCHFISRMESGNSNRCYRLRWFQCDWYINYYILVLHDEEEF